RLPLAIRLGRGNVQRSRLPGFHAEHAILERRKELAGADHHHDGAAVTGRVEQGPVSEMDGVLERHDQALRDRHHTPPRRRPRTRAASSSCSPLDPPLVTTGSPRCAPPAIRPRIASGAGRLSTVSGGCPNPARTWKAVSPPTSTSPAGRASRRAIAAAVR